VLEPRSKNIDPALLMESLFKLSELESRVSMNMNVLDATRTPRVMDLREVLQSWLDHRRVVLLRRSNQRLAKIADRLEILNGYMIAFLNIDEVIRIIRFEDHPKQDLMKAFKLTERQADAILNMRLRALNKLQEFEIQGEHDKLSAERDALNKLVSTDKLQWDAIADQVRETRDLYGPDTELGKRRTTFDVAPEIDVDLATAFITKEPITVVMSEKGWIRTMKGKTNDVSGLKFKRQRIRLSSLRPTANFTHSAPINCRADAGMANPFACWSIWKMTTAQSACSSMTPNANLSSPVMMATASAFQKARLSRVRGAAVKPLECQRRRGSLARHSS